MKRALVDLGEKSEIEIIELVVERYRRRTSWHKAEKGLTLQGRAICRRLCDGDKEAANKLFDRIAKLKPDQIQIILTGFVEGFDEDIIAGVYEVHPILAARAGIEYNRETVEAELESLVKRLPIAAFIEDPDLSGFSYGSLAAIIGSAGNLHTYANVQRLWKRMGLAVMPNGRQRQQRDPEQAALHGYNPQRRSIMWNVGTSLLRAQSQRLAKDEGDVIIGVRRHAGKYRLIYDERKAYESAKNEAGDYAEQAAKRLSEAKFDKKTAAFKAYSEGKLPPLHLHMRAQRFIEKRVLRELWKAWRNTMTKPPAPALEEVARELESAEAA